MADRSPRAPKNAGTDRSAVHRHRHSILLAKPPPRSFPDCANSPPASPLYDVFDNQLPYTSFARQPYNDHDPYPYVPHRLHAPRTTVPAALPTPFMLVQENARKRQRRQTAGNLVVNTFFNRGGGPPPGTVAAAASAAAAAAAKTTPKKKQSTAQPRPLIAVPPGGIGPVNDPNVNDVLSGRGGRINAHVGNVQFREIVAERKIDYLAKATKKLEKAHIAADIVYYIRGMDPPGRFLKEDTNGAWWDIGDQKAIKKVGQALREDAPEIRDPDAEYEVVKKVSAKSASVPPFRKEQPKPAPALSSAESTPIQGNRSLTPATAAGNMPIPPITTSGSGGSGMTATAVSSRGGKLTHSSSSGSVRSGHHNVQQQQQQQQHQPVSFQIELRPETYQTVVPPQPPKHRAGAQQGGTPFYANLGFRGMAPRVGAAVSGAAAAAMKQQQQQHHPIHEFEVPAARANADEAFGRQFHSPPEHQQGESSLLSGFSGGASAISGLSGISALTDPVSSMSNSDTGQARTARQRQLERVKQNWASHAVANSDNTGTIQMLNASNGLGSSLNHSSVIRRAEREPIDDSMSWTGHSLNHSLNGGGLAAPDDSVLFGGTGSNLSNGSGGNHSSGVASETFKDDSFPGTGDGAAGLAYGYTLGSSKHSATSGPYRGAIAPRAPGGPAGDASVTSMSMASTGVDSLPSMSELSENLIALDLASNISGSILDQI